MRLRALLFLVTATAVLGLGASGASAATLFTSTAHTARVAVGATASITGTSLILTSGTAVITNCAHSAFNLTLTQNNDTAVIAEVTSGAFNGCNSPWTPTFPWTVTISGTGAVSGTSTCWTTAVDGFKYDLLGGVYTGNLTTGVTSCQPTAGTSPLQIRLAAAGTVSGPLTGNGRLDVTYHLIGAAAGWSLTN